MVLDLRVESPQHPETPSKTHWCFAILGMPKPRQLWILMVTFRVNDTRKPPKTQLFYFLRYWVNTLRQLYFLMVWGQFRGVRMRPNTLKNTLKRLMVFRDLGMPQIPKFRFYFGSVLFENALNPQNTLKPNVL